MTREERKTNETLAVTERVHLDSTQLYRALSPKSHPALNSLLAILEATGLRLAVQPLIASGQAN